MIAKETHRRTPVNYYWLFFVAIAVLLYSCKATANTGNARAGMFLDSISNWSYLFDKTYKGFRNDSIRAMGLVTFQRVKPPKEGIISETGKVFIPSMDFEIFHLTDSAFATRKSTFTKVISSCMPPNVGGDLFIVGKFIFVNRDVCVNCRQYPDTIDYCRPMIRKILAGANQDKALTLEEILASLPVNPAMPEEVK